MTNEASGGPVSPRAPAPFGSVWVELPESPVEMGRDDEADRAVLVAWAADDALRTLDAILGDVDDDEEQVRADLEALGVDVPAARARLDALLEAHGYRGSDR